MCMYRNNYALYKNPVCIYIYNIYVQSDQGCTDFRRFAGPKSLDHDVTTMNHLAK